MSFVQSSINGFLIAEETYTLPASATIGYSSVIDFLKWRYKGNQNEYATFKFNASAVTGTNLDIALYGSDSLAGTVKYLLKDAVVADIAATGTVAGTIDIKAYPAPYYFLAWTADVDESANTITVGVTTI